MWLAHFYRFYFAVLCGIACYFSAIPSVWFAVVVAICVRVIWSIIEYLQNRMYIQKNFNRHIAEFRKNYGPYGIRIANKAEQEWRIKQSLAEVFTGNEKQLAKTIETLEMMDTLFKAGMRPEGDEFLLHDLKLKYGKERLEKIQKNALASAPHEK